MPTSFARAAFVTAALYSTLMVGSASVSAAPLMQSGIEKFAADLMINAAFQKALDRSPDESEKRRYRVRVFEDHWGQRDIEDDLRGRGDYRNYDDSRRSGSTARMDDREVDRMIRHAYEDELGREPDAAGMRTYRNNVIDRGWTERQVREALRKSPERSQRSAESVDSMIRHAYRDVLGREPDSAGLREYRNQVEEHGWEEHDVAQALRRSAEYRQKNAMTEADARAIVRRAYLSVLEREPDSGSQGFVNRVLRDHWTEREVARELRNSEEFRNKR